MKKMVGFIGLAFLHLVSRLQLHGSEGNTNGSRLL